MRRLSRLVLPSANRKKSRTKTAVRLLVSLVLLGVVYSTVNTEKLLATLNRLTIGGVLMVVALYTTGQILSAFKWRIFVRSAGLDGTWSNVVRAYFFGMFVNNFGLGTVGGDLARSLLLPARVVERAACFATVIADRVHGLLVLSAIGAVAISIVKPAALGNYSSAFAALAVCSLLAGWFIGPILLKQIAPKDSKLGIALRTSANAFPRSLKTIIPATLVSLVFHGFQITMHIVIAKQLGANLDLAYLVATVPVVNIAASLPVSINGLGVRESMYVSLFVPGGASIEVAVAFGAVWILVVTAVSALGGILLPPDIEAAVISDDEVVIVENEIEEKEPKRAVA